MTDASIEVFDRLAMDYDQWFEAHPPAYQSELAAVRRFLPEASKGIEIGAGTGRFCVPLGIPLGVEPSARMAAIARSRGVQVIESLAENLPLPGAAFDFALLVNVVCFVTDPSVVLCEANRILKPHGRIVLAIIDKASPVGSEYARGKDKSRFYRHAHFYSVSEIADFLTRAGFSDLRYCQTIFSSPKAMGGEPDVVEEGHGVGAFVVIGASKNAHLNDRRKESDK